MEKRFFYAVATLVGTTIGAGVLGIPFVVAKAGVLLGLAGIIIIGAAIIMVNLYLGEVVLRTKGKHQLTGYAQKYLGEKGKRIMALTMIFSIYGALTAYIIGVGEALASVFPTLSASAFSLIFFVVAAIIINIGLKAVEKSEFLMAAITTSILALISGISIFSSHFATANLTFIDASKAAVPYGVILFAFLGAVAVPEMSEELSNKKRFLKRAIIVGGLLPLIGYSLFAIAVVGVTGLDTSQIATIKLGDVLGERMVVFANLFAAFAMTTSFLALGLALREMFNYDLGINRHHAWVLTCAVPILAFLIGIKGFIPLLAITGAVAGGIEGIMIVMMHSRAKKLGGRKPEFSIGNHNIISVLLILLFVAGIIYGVLG